MRESVFISYSHRDRKYISDVQKFLEPMDRTGLVDAWVDTRIQPGSNWRDEIERALSRARAAVLLISQDFINSNFIREVEIPRILDRAKHDGMELIPVFLRHATLTEVPWVTELQGVNDPSTPVIRMTRADQERLWVGLHDLLQTILGLRVGSKPALEARTGDGPLIHKACNRKEQEYAFRPRFRAWMQENQWRPMLCFVHGDDGECHASLVERFRASTSEEIRSRGDLYSGSVAHVTFPWPFESPTPAVTALEDVAGRLKLSGVVNHASVQQALQNSRYAIIMVQHDMPTSRWESPGTTEKLRQYVDFWRGLSVADRGARILIFLNVIYEREYAWRRAVGWSRNERILREITALRDDNSLLLNKLAPVTQNDVRQWCRDFGVGDEAEQIRRCRRLFLFRRRLPMSTVEIHLRKWQSTTTN